MFSFAFNWTEVTRCGGRLLLVWAGIFLLGVARTRGVEIDSSGFGDAGVARPVFAASPSQDVLGLGRCLALLPDGKIIVAAKTIADGDSEIALIRYESSGIVDGSFGSQGVVVLRRAGFEDVPTELKILDDGKILIAGHTTSASGRDMLLVRLLQDGSRDVSFGSAGVRLIDFGGEDDAAHGVGLDGSGRLILVGSTSSGNGDLALARCLANGDLDSSFGSGGLVTESLGISTEEGRAVAVQPDGRIVVTGFARLSNNDAFFTCRFLGDGTLDESFAGTGKTSFQFGSGEDRAQSLLIQADGKLIVGGWVSNGDRDFALLRYLTDGTLDPGFGTSGVVSVDFGSTDDLAYTVEAAPGGGFFLGGTSFGIRGEFAVAKVSSAGVLELGFGAGGKKLVGIPLADAEAAGLAVQGDGKVLMSATVTDASTSDIGIIRLTETGDLDADFNGGAVVIKDLGLSTPLSTARAVHPLADGRSLMSGAVLVDGVFQFALMRFLANGVLDTAFGNGGVSLVSVGPEGGLPFALLVQLDGKVVLAGQRSDSGFYQFTMVRFLSDGTPDSSFGVNGLVTTVVGQSDAEIYAIDQQSDGKLVVAGYGYPTTAANIDLAIARYTSSGVLDSTFGTGGVVMVAASGAGDDIATGVDVCSDGKIVASGTRFPSSGSSQFALVRVTSTGALDSTFGTGGKVVTTLPGGDAQAQSLAALPGGGFVVAGTAGAFGDADFACAKYGPTGVLDGSFGTSGTGVVQLGSFGDFCNDVAIDSAGRLVMAGTRLGVSGELALVRLTENGLLDTTFGVSGVAAFDLGPAADVAYAAAYQPDGRLLVAGDSGQRMALARFLIPTPNQDPVAADDVWYAIPGNSVLIPVLANDADGDTDPLFISGFTQPASGGAVGQEGDSLRFTPNGTFAGSTFTYQVSDGQGGSDGATVTVSPVTLFGHWQVARFGLDAGNPAVTGELQDPDLDRIPNLLEYAFALNPLVAEINPPVSARIDSGRLVLTVRRWIGATDLQVQGMFCEDLLGWSNAGVSVSEVSSDGFVATDEHTGPLPGDLRQFGQIEVTK